MSNIFKMLTDKTLYSTGNGLVQDHWELPFGRSEIPRIVHKFQKIPVIRLTVFAHYNIDGYITLHYTRLFREA